MTTDDIMHLVRNYAERLIEHRLCTNDLHHNITANHATEAWKAVKAALEMPIDMVLHCPACGKQHIDAPEDEIDMQCNTNLVPDVMWTNPPHRSHLCHGCGYIWRPADVPTNGVQAVTTRGQNDSPVLAQGLTPEQARKVLERLVETSNELMQRRTP